MLYEDVLGMKDWRTYAFRNGCRNLSTLLVINQLNSDCYILIQNVIYVVYVWTGFAITIHYKLYSDLFETVYVIVNLQE